MGHGQGGDDGQDKQDEGAGQVIEGEGVAGEEGGQEGEEGGEGGGEGDEAAGGGKVVVGDGRQDGAMGKPAGLGDARVGGGALAGDAEKFLELLGGEAGDGSMIFDCLTDAAFHEYGMDQPVSEGEGLVVRGRRRFSEAMKRA